MKSLIGLSMILAAGPSVVAQTYKWVDEKGVTTYGQKPPAGRAATPVDTTPSGSIDTGGPRQEKAEPAKRVPPEPASAAAPPAAPVAAPAHGMEFETFIRLQRGMTEGELLVRAGQPDHSSVENFRNNIVKTYYYFPTSANPFTTVITVRGGRIANLDRVKKF